MDSPSMDQAPPKKPSIDKQTLEHHNDDQQYSGGAGGVDLISNLPDDILSHIISKLPTKYAIGTSILSTRWKHLFSSIPEPYLDFDDTLLFHPTPKPEIGMILPSKERIACFVNFMYRVMDVILKDTPIICTFRLKCHHEYNDYQIIDWVCAALARGVMWLELIFGLNKPDFLFDCLSGWTTVEYLKLENSLIHAPPSFALPNLKELVIVSSHCVTENSLPALLSGCPILEDLTLRSSHFGKLETLNISFPSLKFLVIQDCYNEEVPYEVVLDTPELDTLFYCGSITNGYMVKNLSTLVGARIEFEEFVDPWESDTSKYDQNVFDLVTGCSSVDSLTVSQATLKYLYDTGLGVPMFRNLKHLQLGGFDTNEWELLPDLLESAPNLESLDITEGFCEETGCYERFASSLPVNVPVCLSSHLKKIEIWAFKGEEDGVKLVEYFLKSAKVLNKIDITCDMSWENYYYTYKKLCIVPPISETCQLRFFEI